VSGSSCDLTGKLRTCEVRFYCEPNADVTVITSIKEPSSCNYIIRVDTPLLCKHPKYISKLDEETEKILCFETPIPTELEIQEEEQKQKKQTKNTFKSTQPSTPPQNPEQPKQNPPQTQTQTQTQTNGKSSSSVPPKQQKPFTSQTTTTKKNMFSTTDNQQIQQQYQDATNAVPDVTTQTIKSEKPVINFEIKHIKKSSSKPQNPLDPGAPLDPTDVEDDSDVEVIEGFDIRQLDVVEGVLKEVLSGTLRNLGINPAEYMMEKEDEKNMKDGEEENDKDNF